MMGRRRPDTEMGSLPDDLQPGDIWRVTVRGDTAPALAVNWPGAGPKAAENLTGGVWCYVVPEPCKGLGTLVYHTVREHDDGTVSVRPGDGSSNSILHDDGRGCTWHGFVEHNEWTAV